MRKEKKKISKHKSLQPSVKKKIFVVLLLFLAVFICVSLYFSANINPVIQEMSEAKVRSLMTSAVNSAIYNIMTEPVGYDDLITVLTDNNGKINMIQANSLKVNELARETAKRSQESINRIGEQGLDLPMGSLTGSPVLAGQGPAIHIKILPIGSVTCKFISEFVTAGINQTRHKIYLEVQANVNIVLPVSLASVQSITQVLVCESILIGDVPQTYLDFGTTESLLDLVPNV